MANNTLARSPRRYIEVGLIALALAGANFPSYAQQVDWGQISALLEPGMTEQQVIQTVGYRPNKVELETCGQKASSGPWSCKSYTFGNSYNNLHVFFRQDGGFWVVNSWHVFP
jgi:hypothetical protein